MAIVCRKCGHRNPEGTQFCTRPGCGEYLDWGTQVRTGAVSGTAAVPVGMYTQKSAASIRLSTSDLTVVPGAAVTATATVHNGGTQIEEFTVSVAGQAAAWATVDPPTMRVFPGAEGECVVRFAPPRHSSSVAGKAAFSVTASSSVHRSLVASAQGTLEVGVFRELRASLAPLQTRGRGRTVHTVEVANDGNTTEAVKLTATDPAAAVRFVVPPADVAIRPGSMTIPVPVTPPRQWFGRPRHHQFQVTVTAANRLVPVSGHATPPPATPPAVRLDGTRESVPLIPAWVTRLAALLLVIGVGTVATMAATHTGPFKNAAATIPPSQSPTPSTAPPTTQPPQSPSTAPSSPTVAPGDSLLQAAHNAEGTTLDFHLVMRKPSDLAGTVLDGQYQAGVGVAYSGPALNGTGTLSNQYVSTGNDFYIQCGPTVDPSQCPVHVDMTRQLSDQASGYLFIADPLFAFQLLETATSVTGGPGTYSGTCDLSKINGTLSASTQLASYLLNHNYPRHLQFQATTDGDNRLTGFQTKFDDHQGNVLNYALTLTGFGGTVVVTLPTSSVEADPTWYAN